MSRRWFAGSVAVVGVIGAASSLWHPHLPIAGSTATADRIVDLVLVGGPGLALCYGGYWHATHPLVDGRVAGVVGWMAATALLFVSTGVVSLFIGSSFVGPAELLASVHVAGSVGLAAGLLGGTLQAAAVVNAETAARAEARAAAIETEQRRLAELNDLLRHYVLNGVNVIGGYAAELRPASSAEDQVALTAIEERAETIGRLVEHVRLLPADVEGGDRHDVPLDAAVRSAVASFDGGHPVRLDFPEGDGRPTVSAGATLADALVLLMEAVSRCTAADGVVTATVTVDDATATVSVVGAPAALPTEVERALFEPISGGVGLTLYLAKRLLDGYADVRRRGGPAQEVAFAVTLDRVAGD